LIRSSGFRLLAQHRLPSNAWWDNYYNPLRERIAEFKRTGNHVMQTVINETEEEMKVFKAHHQDYGYTYYIMRAD
jgi:serine/threonine-protein kinase HipA